MKKILLISVLIGLATIGSLLFTEHQDNKNRKELFQEWKQKIGINFEGDEDAYRFAVFQHNLEKINQHNSKIGKTHFEGLNNFAFLTHEQFREQYLSTFQSYQPNIISSPQQDKPTGPSINWVQLGVVSPVKDQLSCLASYAFSAVGAIEAISVLQFNLTVEYSAQQLVDCTVSYGNQGCNGGNMNNCFNFAKDFGLYNQSTYNYTGNFSSCQNKTGQVFKIIRYINVGSCTDLANSLMNQPISVAVDGQNFQFYKGGIFNDCGIALSLGTLLVGMTDSFWALKNSWGVHWGQNGYIRIARGNTCGVCQAASYPRAK